MSENTYIAAFRVIGGLDSTNSAAFSGAISNVLGGQDFSTAVSDAPNLKSLGAAVRSSGESKSGEWFKNGKEIGSAAKKLVERDDKLADRAKTIRDEASSLGISTDDLQALWQMGKATGLEFSKTSEILRTFKKTVQDTLATGSGDGYNALVKLKLDPQALQSKGMGDTIRSFLDSLQAYNGSDKGNLVATLGGQGSEPFAHVGDAGSKGIDNTLAKMREQRTLFTPKDLQTAKAYQESKARLDELIDPPENLTTLGIETMPLMGKVYDTEAGFIKQHPTGFSRAKSTWDLGNTWLGIGTTAALLSRLLTARKGVPAAAVAATAGLGWLGWQTYRNREPIKDSYSDAIEGTTGFASDIWNGFKYSQLTGIDGQTGNLEAYKKDSEKVKEYNHSAFSRLKSAYTFATSPFTSDADLQKDNDNYVEWARQQTNASHVIRERPNQLQQQDQEVPGVPPTPVQRFNELPPLNLPLNGNGDTAPVTNNCYNQAFTIYLTAAPGQDPNDIASAIPRIAREYPDLADGTYYG
ncbi:MAG: hypothetical protein ACFUZC_03365 [Chthoniobacteraceae bacterium]